MRALRPGGAIGPEQRALRELQKAEETYERFVSLDARQGGGGGQGGGPSAEDLADLFELETDQLRNQYEMVQRSRRQTADDAVDQSLEKLRELARRQEAGAGAPTPARGCATGRIAGWRRGRPSCTGLGRGLASRPRRRPAGWSGCRGKRAIRAWTTCRANCSERRMPCAEPRPAGVPKAWPRRSRPCAGSGTPASAWRACGASGWRGTWRTCATGPRRWRIGNATSQAAWRRCAARPVRRAIRSSGFATRRKRWRTRPARF